MKNSATLTLTDEGYAKAEEAAKCSGICFDPADPWPTNITNAQGQIPVHQGM